MKDKKRAEAARRRAEAYAPRPDSSVLMYGLVGVILAGLGLILFARFYDLNPLKHPFLVAVGCMFIFIASLGLWQLRTRRHDAALRREYDDDGSK